MTNDPLLDFEEHWSNSVETYISHPTSRHRRRFVLRSLRRLHLGEKPFIFDYGCGPGILLQEVQEMLHLRPEQLGGCDISQQAIIEARTRLASPHLSGIAPPVLDRLCDVIICSEVIEHAENYDEILAWIAEHLAPGGVLILTVPAGRVTRPDAYYGHLRHFTVRKLTAALEGNGLAVTDATRWGFPLFSLQKWITEIFFGQVKTSFMEGSMSPRKRVIFGVFYYVYLVHALIPLGPQIFLTARPLGRIKGQEGAHETQ
jgi:SAM-dependent methyltransferase